MSRKGVATNCAGEVDLVTESYYVVQRMEIRVWPLDAPDTVKAASLYHGAILHPAIEVCVCVCMDGSCIIPVCLSNCRISLSDKNRKFHHAK